jgi:hypothetical protein
MKNTGYDLTSGRSRAFDGGDRNKEAEMGSEITIRRSTKADIPQIEQLAQLDSRHTPVGDVLLAYVDHELRAAVEVDSGEVVADPFHPTADLVELLRMRADGLHASNGFGLRAFRHAAQAA